MSASTTAQRRGGTIRGVSYPAAIQGHRTFPSIFFSERTDVLYLTDIYWKAYRRVVRRPLI